MVVFRQMLQLAILNVDKWEPQLSGKWFLVLVILIPGCFCSLCLLIGYLEPLWVSFRINSFLLHYRHYLGFGLWFFFFVSVSEPTLFSFRYLLNLRSIWTPFPVMHTHRNLFKALLLGMLLLCCQFILFKSKYSIFRGYNVFFYFDITYLYLTSIFLLYI